jgi:hypothetical protein
MTMGRVVVLGVFVADTAYRADRQPKMGETIMGRSFALGPGGKGSNQAVAAAQAGAETHMITRLARDPFGDMALATWAKAGVLSAVTQVDQGYTGAAYIFVEEATGNNAIIVCPGVAGDISVADIEARADLIGGAAVFVTQLEQPQRGQQGQERSIGQCAGVIYGGCFATKRHGSRLGRLGSGQVEGAVPHGSHGEAEKPAKGQANGQERPRHITQQGDGHSAQPMRQKTYIHRQPADRRMPPGDMACGQGGHHGKRGHVHVAPRVSHQ